MWQVNITSEEPDQAYMILMTFPILDNFTLNELSVNFSNPGI